MSEPRKPRIFLTAPTPISTTPISNPKPEGTLGLGLPVEGSCPKLCHRAPVRCASNDTFFSRPYTFIISDTPRIRFYSLRTIDRKTLFSAILGPEETNHTRTLHPFLTGAFFPESGQRPAVGWRSERGLPELKWTPEAVKGFISVEKPKHAHKLRQEYTFKSKGVLG